ncbi:hypothetical protein QLX08_000409 [Tetragonisca angustula]|uniref:Uncharacterized protein n=1 Tax=Tetragonisca angustula TaxID=166442 RepID=A0AAW1ALL6_9HYME
MRGVPATFTNRNTIHIPGETTNDKQPRQNKRIVSRDTEGWKQFNDRPCFSLEITIASEFRFPRGETRAEGELVARVFDNTENTATLCGPRIDDEKSKRRIARAVAVHPVEVSITWLSAERYGWPGHTQLANDDNTVTPSRRSVENCVRHGSPPDALGAGRSASLARHDARRRSASTCNYLHPFHGGGVPSVASLLLSFFLGRFRPARFSPLSSCSLRV